MKRTLVSLVILAGWGLCAGAAVAAGEGGEIFQLIESQQFDLAEKKAREELQTATGEDRNAYLFILGFIQAKQGKSEDVRRVVSAIDPASEWAPDGQFLLMIYAPARGAPEKSGGGPMVSIRIAQRSQIAVGSDRFTQSGKALKKNGHPVQVPFEIPRGAHFERRGYRGKLEVDIEKGQVVLINTLPIEDYLYGVLKNEINPGWAPESVKAQAIASRTYVLRRIELARSASRKPVRLAADVSIQVYHGRTSEDPRVQAAVDATRGQVLVYKGDLIEAVFHSESGGATESSADLWGRSYPYLISKPDPYSGTSPYANWHAEFTEEEVLKALGKELRGKVGRIRSITVAESSQSGRVKRLAVLGARGEAVIPAGKFRLALGPDRLRSLLWTELDYQNRKMAVRGRGWGHGVGLSQWSSKVAAEKGLTCREILNFYFPGGEIMTRY